jgi:hypothetical protein
LLTLTFLAFTQVLSTYLSPEARQTPIDYMP